MNLYLIAYEKDHSCDWFFITSKKDLLNENDTEVRKLIAENYDIELNDFDDYITDYLVNKIDEVNGYKVKLVKA